LLSVVSSFLDPAQLRLTQLWALAVDAQGGITLGPESGELGADFCYLGKITRYYWIFMTFV
jgi:hypothetical protein